MLDREGLAVMLERRGVIATPLLDEAADEDHRVNDEGQCDPGRGHGVADAAHALGQGRRQSGIALAREHGIRLASEHPALREKRRERETQQNDAERGGAALVELRADDGEKYFGESNPKVPARDDGV